MVKFTETKTEDLIKRIENLKAERERTADCLERLEAELERRKQEVPLGVPLPDKDGAPFVGVYELGFSSEKSFFTFSTRFQNYVTATRDNTKGEPIDITVLLLLMKKGWVAMDMNGDWYWYKEKPILRDMHWSLKKGDGFKLGCFKLKPADNWEDSLMECGLCTG